VNIETQSLIGLFPARSLFSWTSKQQNKMAAKCILRQKFIIAR